MCSYCYLFTNIIIKIVANILTLQQIWVELPNGHSLHNAPYHNYASFNVYMIT